jgi:hypothetical protein
MKNDEMARLLGGYATNTLTEAERQALFSAALDDQELFNALQDEEALRDLLEDTASRTAVARALREPAKPVKTAWFGRPWLWGVAAASLAATCVLVFVIPQRKAQNSVQVASVEPARVATPTADAPKGKAFKVENQALEAELARSASKPRVRENLKMKIAPEQQAASVPAPAQPLPAAAAPPVSDTVAGALSAPVASAQAFRTEARSQGALVTAPKAILAFPIIAVLRGDTRLAPSEIIQNGDSIRLAIRPVTAGVVNLYRGDALLSGPLNVEAGREYVIPETPIIVSGDMVLRLAVGSTQTTLTLTPGKPVQIGVR